MIKPCLYHMYEQTEEYIAEHCLACPTEIFRKCKKYSLRPNDKTPDMPAPVAKRGRKHSKW